MKNEIVFWFNIPPKVEKGAFNYLSQKWENKVYYVINNDLASYRKKNGWDDNDFGNAIVIKLWEKQDKENEIKRICQEHADAIHILNGFTNEIQLYARKYLFELKAKIGAYTERPNYNDNNIELLIRNVFFHFRYRYLAYLYKKHIDFVLPLGKKGVEAFAKYGWEKEKLYPFMYNPNIPVALSPSYRPSIRPVRFVYVGRFYYKTKGVDTLMKACDKLSGEWSIDFVGGYGAQREKVLKWIQATPQARFIGNWDAKDVVEKLNQYDLVVVPSKFDGWNLLINESIYASVGVIVSDEATSDEVIKESQSGTIFKAKSSDSLAEVMQSVIDNPSIINEWKNKAHMFQNQISSPVVGEYLINILNYVYYGGEYPECPWTK